MKFGLIIILTMYRLVQAFEPCRDLGSPFRTSVLELEANQVSNESLILAQNQRWRRA